MKGLKIVSKFSDRMQRSRFTYFPDLPEHVQKLVILHAAKLRVPRLYRQKSVYERYVWEKICV